MIGKLTTLVVILIPVFLVTAIIYGSMVGKKMISCYDDSRITFDDAEYRIRAQGWDDKKLCEIKYDSLDMLDKCVESTKNESKFSQMIFPYVFTFSESLISSVRPIENLMAEHDENCADYPAFIFNPVY